MDERVYPRESPSSSPENQRPLMAAQANAATAAEKPMPKPGTYVVHVPKEMVYRVPPPANAARYEELTRRGKAHRRCPCCCRFLCWLLVVVVALLIAIAVSAAVAYLVLRPEAPKYSVKGVSISGINASSTAAAISPVINVTVRAENPNDKIGIRYERGGTARVLYESLELAEGTLPVFLQRSNNVTVFLTALRGRGVRLGATTRQALAAAQRSGKVPLRVVLKAPVRIRVGSLETWKITAKVSCDVTVDKLTAAPRIVSVDCDYGVDLW